jgi:hypothetical protein
MGGSGVVRPVLVIAAGIIVAGFALALLGKLGG